MQAYANRHRWFLVLAAVGLLGLGTGCATNGRRLLLKEYVPTGPLATNRPLQGLVVCIKPFRCATNLVEPAPTTKPEEPSQFKFVPLTKQQDDQWASEFRALEKTKPQSEWFLIGNVRNGFGMVLSHVYALNDPGAWVADTLKMDLESQGAKVVDSSQADSADLCLSGTVQFCRVDMYMKIWADLVVDLELQPKNAALRHKVIHTSGGLLSWVGSEGEFYNPIRESRQKFSWLASREIAAAMNR